MHLLSGTSALVVLTAVIVGVAIYGAAALLMAAPADLLIDRTGSTSPRTVGWS